MTTKYIPRWKDDKGNVVLIPARNHIYDTWQEAFDFQAAEFIFYIPFGLVTDGILEVEADENMKAELRHCVATLGLLGKVLIIEGPLLEQTMEVANDG